MSAESTGNGYTRETSEVTLSEWAKARDPDLFVVSKSEPEPVFMDYNLIAVSRDPQELQEVLRKWERVQPADAGVGFVAMSRSSATFVRCSSCFCARLPPFCSARPSTRT